MAGQLALREDSQGGLGAAGGPVGGLWGLEGFPALQGALWGLQGPAAYHLTTRLVAEVAVTKLSDTCN